MKTIIPILAILAIPAIVHASTWTVDNVAAHPADFRTIQDAVNAAVVGDTILVAGSAQTYGGFTSTKRLNIRGERPGPLSLGVTVGVISNTFTSAILTEVLDDTDPNHLRNAGGSLLEALRMTSTVYIYGPCSGVTVRRCIFDNSFNLYGCSGTLVLNCECRSLTINERRDTVKSRFFVGTGNNIMSSWLQEIGFYLPTNTLVENCVVGYYVGSDSQQNGPILGAFGTNTAPFVLRNSVIIGKTTIYQSSDSGTNKAVFDHCMSIGGTTLPSGSGNLSLAYNQFANVFVNATPNLKSPETFVLKAASPAIGAGLAGTDLGMYGGASPFIPGLIPALPRITYLAVPPIVPDSTGLTFEVSAEARD